jgi:DNA uptake protein ComE-like DNA-binding protein
MNASSLDTLQSAAVQLARLSGPHGYRLDGDLVHLNAMFALLDGAAHERSWALQLWACPSAPNTAADLAGHLVAEVALPPMGELADESEHFEVSTLTWPPAGNGEHVMVLVLAAGRPGQFNDVHDFAVYSNRQQFAQPCIGGTVGYSVDGNRVQITVDRVENPRDASNQSGTLSLELWALPTAYAGGQFEGQHLAGVEIGTLNGQNELLLQPLDLNFQAPSAGTWQIVLMLREWTALGFVTRDFVNFGIPYVVTAPVVAAPPAPVAKVAPAVVVTPTPAAAPVAVVAKAAPLAPATPVATPTPSPAAAPAKAAPTVAPAKNHVAVPPVATRSPLAPSALVAPVSTPAKAAAPVVEKTVAPIAKKATVTETAKASAKDTTVSINKASVEDLAAVDGLNLKLAQGIARKRPYASLDDLSSVKGLGPKILAKIRARLKL